MVDLVGWESFNEPMDYGFEETLTPVAQDVLDTFGISYNGTGGGTLNKVDLYRVDALSAIKASLLENLADINSKLIEITVNADGKVEFIDIGSGTSGITGYIYYTVKSATHSPASIGVMVTGGKPQPERRISEWNTLIGSSDEGKQGTVWDTHYITSECTAPQFSTSCAVTYDDPHLTTGNKNWRDGVEGLFEFDSPFENIIGYVWSVDPGDNVGDTVKIIAKNQTTIPLLVQPVPPARDPDTGAREPIYKLGQDEHFPSVGTLYNRTSVDLEAAGGAGCWAGENPKVECTAGSLNISVEEFDFVKTVRGIPINKLMGVSSVFLKGVPLEACWGVVTSAAEFSNYPSEGNTELFISSSEVTNVAQQIVKLSEGEDYVIGYADDEWATPCITFANNTRKNDYIKCGSGVDGEGIEFIINDRDASLKALFEKTSTDINGVTYGKGTVLPLGGQGAGFLVEQVWAQLELDLPCFLVEDPRGNAKDVAEQLVVRLAALSIFQEPEPIAINGVLVDQVEMQEDNDPTTSQSFIETDYERQMKNMSSGRTLNLKSRA